MDSTRHCIAGNGVRMDERMLMGVDTSTEGGSAFIKSLYQIYASWGVDLSRFFQGFVFFFLLATLYIYKTSKAHEKWLLPFLFLHLKD